jgi:osmoprotectant transport system ATP-binding protein
MIVFNRVFKRYAGRAAIDQLSLEIFRGETLVLLGRSGSGKTTALKLINRLIDPDSGTISLDGNDLQKLDPIQLRRHIGYAVQQIGLFPHMTVEENIGIVPKLLGWSDERIQERVTELLGIIGLPADEYRKRHPLNLSGGQRQRIGVARALAADPPVILMDEPFGALDPLTRQQLQNEFLTIASEIHKTIVFVTHDVQEAIKLGDRIAVMDEGKLIQLATPEELVKNPATPFIEEFMGVEVLT